MHTKRWIPLTGELVLRALDQNSGLTFDQLMDELGLYVGPGPMALIWTLVELSDAGLVAIDGQTSVETHALVRTGLSRHMWNSTDVWRTTDQWMKTTSALTHVHLGSRRSDSAQPLLCYPAFGPPGNHLEQTDIFVLMPFSADLRPVYDDHLRKVASELSLSIKRADDFYTNSALMMDIWSAIYASSLVVADCTGRNPNVFYELGIAHTVGVPAIMISQSEEDIPADLRHLRYYIYEFTPRGMNHLEVAIRNVIETTMLFRDG